MKPDKNYTLKIPRAQYNRLGRAFTLDDTYFDKLKNDVQSEPLIFNFFPLNLSMLCKGMSITSSNYNVI